MTHVGPFLKDGGVREVTAELLSGSWSSQGVQGLHCLPPLWPLARFSSPLDVLVGTVD